MLFRNANAKKTTKPKKSKSKVKAERKANVSSICARSVIEIDSSDTESEHKSDNVDLLFKSDEEEKAKEEKATEDKDLQNKLKQYDDSCQKGRKSTKVVMAAKKAEAAKTKAAKAAKASKIKADAADKKAEAAKTKAAKAKATKAKTAKSKATKAKAAKSKAAKTKAAKAVKASKSLTGSLGVKLKVGMKVSARWNGIGPEKGHWFDGHIVSINTKKETVHVKFDDGDEDNALPWYHVSIVSDVVEG